MSWIVYWPVLIAFWMVLRAASARLLRRPLDSSRAEAAVLLLVMFSGGTLTAFGHLSERAGRALGFDVTGDVWSMTGNRFEFVESHEARLTQGAVVEILNKYGDVEVRREDSDRVTLKARKIVRASSVEEGKRMNDGFSFQIEEKPEGLSIRSTWDDDGAHRSGRERYRSSLIVGVPAKASVHVVCDWGDVVAPVDLRATAECRHGALVLQ